MRVDAGAIREATLKMRAPKELEVEAFGVKFLLVRATWPEIQAAREASMSPDGSGFNFTRHLINLFQISAVDDAYAPVFCFDEALKLMETGDGGEVDKLARAVMDLYGMTGDAQVAQVKD